MSEKTLNVFIVRNAEILMDYSVLLFSAVFCHHEDVVELLLSHGINTSILDCDGQAVTDLDTTPEIKQLLNNDVSSNKVLQT